ncbi:MAG: peptidylprolyl isomerase, partial [Pseudomonadota bacterium]
MIMSLLARTRVCALGAAAIVALSGALAQSNDASQRTPQQIIEEAPADAWRAVDLENALLMDVPAGKIVIELRPDFAPLHVAQIKTLAREKFYDGLTFHRVLEGFVAQGGDPNGDGTGGSALPNIEPEFARDTNAVQNFTEIGRDRISPRVGYVDGMPVAAQPEALRAFKVDRSVDLWPLHCPGVMSMARATLPNSANSQFFLMLGDSRLNLDRRYSGWGWIIDGFEATRRINRGEPPDRPTPIMRVRVAADAPAQDQPEIQVLRTDHP